MAYQFKIQLKKVTKPHTDTDCFWVGKFSPVSILPKRLWIKTYHRNSVKG